MARLNTPQRGEREHLRTHEGAIARRITPEQQLRRSVMACLLWEKTFYESGVEISERIAELIKQVPPAVVAQMAVEAREKMKLRHVPLLMVRELAREGGSRLVGDTLSRVIQRPDELTEFLAIYWKDGREPLSAQVKRGLAQAFTKFDAYQLAKYDRPGAVKLRDVLFLCHAKPKDEEQDRVWKQLIDGTLPAPDTWEVGLSAGEDKLVTWQRLLEENKLGALALLRNLRNMLECGVPQPLIRASLHRMHVERVLPFRFIAAAKYAPQLEPDLEAAMMRSLGSMGTLPGKTALVVDHSQSMTARLSHKSEMIRFEAACGLAILLREICQDVVVIAFSSPIMAGWGRVAKLNAPVVVAPRRGFALRDALHESLDFWGTNTEDGKQLADKEGYDRIVLITDEQSHQEISGPKGLGYCINVAPYRNGIGYGRWTHIDGWSEAVVDYIREFEKEDLGLEE